MAVLKNSPLEGMRGTGELVFRTWNGKTYVYAKSTKPRKQSDAQKKHRERVSECILESETHAGKIGSVSNRTHTFMKQIWRKHSDALGHGKFMGEISVINLERNVASFIPLVEEFLQP